MLLDDLSGSIVPHAKSGVAMRVLVEPITESELADYDWSEPDIVKRRLRLVGDSFGTVAELTVEHAQTEAGDEDTKGALWVLDMETNLSVRRSGHMTTLVRWLCQSGRVRSIDAGGLLEDGAKFFPVFQAEAERCGVKLDGEAYPKDVTDEDESPTVPQWQSPQLSTWVDQPPIDLTAYLPAKPERERLRSGYVRGATVLANSRETPAVHYQAPSLGAWRMDDFKGLHGREIAQLRRVAVADLGLVEEDWTSPEYAHHAGKAEDARRYAQWLREGVVPPPVEVVETDQGKLNLAGDGHRRVAAHKLAGIEYILAWVCPCMDHPEGLRRDAGAGPVLRVGMTYEGAVAFICAEAKQAPTVDEFSLPLPSEVIAHASVVKL